MLHQIRISYHSYEQKMYIPWILSCLLFFFKFFLLILNFFLKLLAYVGFGAHNNSFIQFNTALYSLCNLFVEMKSSNNECSDDTRSSQCYASVPDFLWRHHKQLHLPPNDNKYITTRDSIKSNTNNMTSLLLALEVVIFDIQILIATSRHNNCSDSSKIPTKADGSHDKS